MGTITKGILGGFSGTVGTVVGANWRGKDIIRSRPKKSKKEPTEAQLLQQMKLRLVTKFLTPINSILRQYFGNSAGVRSRINLACAYTINEAVAVVAGIPELIFNKVLVTKGELPGFQNLTVTPQAGRQIAYSWEDNSAQGYAKATDIFCTVIYCEELKEFELMESTAQRSDLAETQTLPEVFQGKEVQVYCYFHNADGNKACNSLYAGMHTVL